MGCHALLQGIFLTQWLSAHLFRPLHWQASSLPSVPPEKPRNTVCQKPNLVFPTQPGHVPPTPSHSHGLEAGLRNEGLRGGFQRKFRCFNSKNRKELSRKGHPPHLKDRCGMGVGDGERAGKTQSDYHSSLEWALWNALWGHLEAAWWAGFSRRSFRETRDSRGSLWNN